MILEVDSILNLHMAQQTKIELRVDLHGFSRLDSQPSTTLTSRPAIHVEPTPMSRIGFKALPALLPRNIAKSVNFQSMFGGPPNEENLISFLGQIHGPSTLGERSRTRQPRYLATKCSISYLSHTHHQLITPNLNTSQRSTYEQVNSNADSTPAGSQTHDGRDSIQTVSRSRSGSWPRMWATNQSSRPTSWR